MGFRIEQNGAVTMARLTTSSGQLDTEANGALFNLSSFTDGTFTGFNKQDEISGTYSIDTTLLSGNYHPRLYMYAPILEDQYLPGGSAGDWSVNGYYVKVLNTDDTDPVIPAPNDLPASLGTGMVAFFPFNGNTNDESGNNNNGIVSGALLTKDRKGNENKAYNFVRSSYSTITVLHNSSLNLDNFSISVWIKPTLSSTENSGACFISKGIMGVTDHYFYLYIRDDGRIRLHFTYAYMTYLDFYTKGAYSLNNWSHIVLVYNNNEKTLSFYLNGSLDNTCQISRLPSFNEDDL